LVYDEEGEEVYAASFGLFTKCIREYSRNGKRVIGKYRLSVDVPDEKNTLQTGL
jgi:hypothetical protein